ncbi:MAG: helix-turn-helix domain-containing protein [Bacteroidia bacterium]
MSNNPRKRRKEPIPGDVIRYVELSLNIARQIDMLLNKKGKNRAYLAQILGKEQSEISKWMSGTHNFTLKTISKIEDKLGESIILCAYEIQSKPKIDNAVPKTMVFDLQKVDSNSKILSELHIVEGCHILSIGKNKQIHVEPIVPTIQPSYITA